MAAVADPPTEKQMTLPKFEGYSVTEHFLNFGNRTGAASSSVVVVESVTTYDE